MSKVKIVWAVLKAKAWLRMMSGKAKVLANALLDNISGLRTLIALMLFFIAWTFKKVFGLDAQPSAMIYGGIALLAVLRFKTTKPAPAWAKKITNVVVAISTALTIAFTINPQWSAKVMRFDVGENPAINEVAPVPPDGPGPAPLELPVDAS